MPMDRIQTARYVFQKESCLPSVLAEGTETKRALRALSERIPPGFWISSTRFLNQSLAKWHGAVQNCWIYVKKVSR